VFHSVIALEKKLYWYDVVDEDGIVKWMVDLVALIDGR